MKVAFIGTGYVGLVSATAFAEMGNDVTCVDVDQKKVDKLSSGKLTIYEPGLDDLFLRNIRENRLSFTTKLEEAVKKSTILFLTLPTPPQEDGSADLSYVMNVTNQLATLLDSYKLVVTKSTVPVGTADKIRTALEAKGLRSGVHFDVVSNPEFLREGSAVQDFMKPERVVIGTRNPAAAELMRSLYDPFVRNGNPIIVMDERSSELVKYASNGFLAMKISFINEIANLCEAVGADVERVRQGMGKDSRIGSQFLYAGLGYGGSCFPKDVQALARTSKEFDYNFQILKAVMNVNEMQRENLLEKVVERFGDLTGKQFAVWGLAFKPNTDDVREAPALWLIEQLVNRGAKVVAYDPEGLENALRSLKVDIQWAKDRNEVLNNSDALIICTEWNEFRNPDWDVMKSSLNNQIIFDGRNLYDSQRVAELGFEYYSIGRPFIAPTASEKTSIQRAA
ncbi:MAG TPA: UDP-glucose/GDP-mannose dehydrogenase family protein [Cyclobacteriaceae bacterium]|nr:UDP-glucose/GDP-mannose dehydrogenase family protein [Cyclobacteriaceae bacterium]